MNLEKSFAKIATEVGRIAGKPLTFLVMFMLIIAWAGSGPIFKFSDTWQLVVNTATTILTFLMVFVLQNTQNRDGRALHAKMDEILHCLKGARNDLERLEDKTEDEIEELRR